VLELPAEADVLAKLVAWGEASDSVLAMILTSSRARADETVDELSDYDVIVACRDPAEMASDTAWTAAYEQPAAGWGDESEVLGSRAWFRGVVYEDGVKIDWTLWPEELLARTAESESLPEHLDVGYRVLLDKTGATSAWRLATHQAHVPAGPTEAEYRALVEEFWWSTTYVAKALRRGELVFAKFPLELDMKFGCLLRMLDWQLELEHDWSLRPGKLGRGLERLLPADVYAELAATYVDLDVDANWEALFRTTVLFRRVAGEVGDALGYAYPQRTDEVVESYLRAVRG